MRQRKKASDFDQRLLELYDGYVHGKMSKRAFLENASKYAVGGVTAAALLDALKPDYAMAQQVAPDDPEILEWADGLTDPVGRRGGEEVAGEQPVTDLDQETVCKQLFESGLTSYRITRTFEERFAGKTVQWSGTLRRVDPYTVDLVFDGGPGCRAMIAVHTIASTGYGDQVVTAIVRYPRDSLQVLAAREGETLSFSGELKKIDALMRNIYVQT